MRRHPAPQPSCQADCNRRAGHEGGRRGGARMEGRGGRQEKGGLTIITRSTLRRSE